jgi:prepilin-type N-terminal cleavage/methylation domain-containing protein
MLRDRRGFSVSEMLTVVAVTALLAGIAAPKLSSLSERYRLSSAVQEMAFDIGRARMQAIGENVYTRVRMGNTSRGGVYWIEKSEDGVSYAIDGPFNFLPKGVAFSTMPSVIPSFNRLGLMPATSSMLLHNTRSEQKLIRVTTIGKITVSDFNYLKEM